MLVLKQFMSKGRSRIVRRGNKEALKRKGASLPGILNSGRGFKSPCTRAVRACGLPLHLYCICPFYCEIQCSHGAEACRPFTLCGCPVF